MEVPIKDKTDSELENIVALKVGTSEATRAKLELERRQTQPERICGISVAKAAFAIAVAALIASIVALLK